MGNVVSNLLKINIRARSMESARNLLVETLGGENLNDRGAFVHPRDAQGIGLEFVEGPLTEI